MSAYAPQLLNSFLLTVVLIILLRDLAARTGLLDRPDDRKRHNGQIPLVGGLAMFPAFLVAFLFLDAGFATHWGLLGGLTILVAIGALDDRFGLRAATRLTIQLAAATIMVWPLAGAVVWIGGVQLGSAGLPIALIFVVGLANAFNMMDGLDGLAGGVAAVALFWLSLTAIAMTRDDAILATLPLLFAVLGFLVFNLRHRWRGEASVFMGDAGSLMLGAAVAYFILVLASGGERSTSVAPLLWICALPAIETLSLIVRRIHARRSPMMGDRRHLHHLLVDAGITPERAAYALIAISAILGAIGYVAARLGAPTPALIAGFIVIAGAHSLVVAKAPEFVRLRLAKTRALDLETQPSPQFESLNA